MLETIEQKNYRTNDTKPYWEQKNQFCDKQNFIIGEHATRYFIWIYSFVRSGVELINGVVRDGISDCAGINNVFTTIRSSILV